MVRDSQERAATVVIALVACAALVYEVLLTRVCALRLSFHYSYLVISNALLLVGASGSWLYLARARLERDPTGFVWRACLGFLVSLPPTWLLLVLYPVPSEVQVGEPRLLASFLGYNLCAALPFFFAGLAIGGILSAWPARAGRLYGADLAGAGLGAIGAPFALWWSGAGGAFSVVFLLTAAACVAGAPAHRRRAMRAAGAALLVLGVLGVLFLDRALPVPSKRRVEVTEDVALDTAHALYSRWSAISRVDLHPVPASERQLFGRGRKAMAIALPDQRFLVQDGDAGTYVSDFTREPAALEALARSAYSAASTLIPGARVLVIGAGGGHDVWAALHAGAESVRGVELNRQILDVHRTVLKDLSRGMLDDPRAELVHGEGRAWLVRDDAVYDVVQMSGIDTWTALASGGYTLAENYLYTVEAVRDMLARLAPGGLLQVTRYAQEVEPLRWLVNLEQALGPEPGWRLADSIVLLHTPPFVTTIAKKGAFDAGELARLERFTAEAGIEVAYRPDARTGNVFDAYLTAPDRASFLRELEDAAGVDLSPTTDDRPYFFSFTRWRDPLASARTIDAPVPVTQGNPLFLLGQLAFAILAAALLVLAPLARAWPAGVERGTAARLLVYFAGLGLGFIGVEIALLQKLVLPLGHPLHSLVVTLAAVLVFAGAGSLVSERFMRGSPARIWLVPAGLALLLGALVLASPHLAPALARAPALLRFGGAAAIVAPVALLLGVPFAHGLRVLERVEPALVPWAWAVNASCTVVGSILTVVVSMNLGFRYVFLVAVLCYAASAAALSGMGARR